MSENDNNNKKGILGFFQGAVDTVKSTVENVKLPEIKLPEIKLPGSKPGDQKPEEPVEITALTIKSVLKIIYYLMSADGRIKREEEDTFCSIGKELDPNFILFRSLLVDQCRTQIRKALDSEDEIAVLQDGIGVAIAESAKAKDAIISPKVLVWDLLTVAYSDGEYDEKERQLINYVVRELNVDKAVLLEMESSFLTLMDLENEMKWIKTTDRSYKTIETVVNEISDRKTVIAESIKDLIAF